MNSNAMLLCWRSYRFRIKSRLQSKSTTFWRGHSRHGRLAEHEHLEKDLVLTTKQQHQRTMKLQASGNFGIPVPTETLAVSRLAQQNPQR